MDIRHVDTGGRPALVVTDAVRQPFSVAHFRIEGETTQSSGSGHAYTDVSLSFTSEGDDVTEKFKIRITGGGERSELAAFFDHAAELLRALP